jgi:hypothetical protein
MVEAAGSKDLMEPIYHFKQCQIPEYRNINVAFYFYLLLSEEHTYV